MVLEDARIIAHVDMDAFYAAVEVLDNPELGGSPVIVGGLSQRGVVSSASYEARGFGVRSAMPMFRARELCPHAVYLPVRMSRYKEVSQRVMEALGAMSPQVEQVSIDEAYLDLSGTRRLHGPPRDAGRKIKARVLAESGIKCTVGIGPNRVIAKLASSLAKPDGLMVVDPEGVDEFLTPLEVGALPGVGGRVEEKLRARGIRSAGDLRKVELKKLYSWFGKFGEVLFRLAAGGGAVGLKEYGGPKSVSSEATLTEDLSEKRELKKVLAERARQVARRLKKKGLRGRKVTLKLKSADFTLKTRTRSLDSSTDLAADIEAAASGLLDKEDVSSGVRLVGVGVSALEGAGLGLQLELFGEPEEKKRLRRLEEAMEEIRERFGPAAVRAGELLNSEE